MYKIFLDKSKIFECDVNIEGASLNKSEVRLCLEAEGFVIVLNGDIESNGSVKIPIKNLNGVLKEGYTGKISLEVIAEDTRFIPWEDEFQTNVSKKVNVKIKENVSEYEEPKKPKVSFMLKETIDVNKEINDIHEILKKNNVSMKTLHKNKPVLEELIKTYCQRNDIKDIKTVNEIRKQLSKI